MSTDLHNPYPGLRSYTPKEALSFFGRSKQITELMRKIRRNRFVAVLGASGSGKSSLVRAGIIPQLRGDKQTENQITTGNTWLTVEMTPGADPIYRMAVKLAKLKAEVHKSGDEQNATDLEIDASMIEATLTRSSLGLVNVIAQMKLEQPLFILVDQFEELFRVQHKGHRDPVVAFIKLIQETIAQREVPVYIVITMRSDFFGVCSRIEGLPEAINHSQYLVPQLSRDDCCDVIIGPLSAQGLNMSARLLNRILNDIGDNPDPLPTLQHALMRTWQYWSQNQQQESAFETIDLSHYEAIGSLSNALNHHADHAYESLTDDQKKIAQILFTCLGELSTDHQVTRRIVPFREIVAVCEAEEHKVVSVIDVFRGQDCSFIMPHIGIPLTPETLIDISHESLFRVWKRLMRWLQIEQIAAKDYQRLVESARRYANDEESLLRDPELALALKWRDQHQPNSSWSLRYGGDFKLAMEYLNQSFEQARVEKQREREQQEYELQIQKQKNQERQKRIVLQRRLLLLGALSIIGMCIFAVNIYIAKLKAESFKLAIDAENNIIHYPELALLKALEAVDTYDTRAAQSALNQAFMASKLRKISFDPARDVIASMPLQKRQTLVVDHSGNLIWWDIANGERIELLSLKNNERINIAKIAGNQNDGLVALGLRSGLFKLYRYHHNPALDTNHKLIITPVFTGQHGKQGQNSVISALAISDDLNWIATGDFDKRVLVWNFKNAHSTPITVNVQHTEAISSLAFSHNAQHLASGGWDARINICNLALPSDQSSCKLLLPKKKSIGANVSALAFKPGDNNQQEALALI